MWHREKGRIGESVIDLLASRNDVCPEKYSVAFRHVSVEGWGQGVQPAPTVSTAVRPWFNLLSFVNLKRQRPSRVLLHDFTGSLNGGEMLAVLGKPGSGCTTFLKTMSNMRDEYKDTVGHISYGGIQPSGGRDLGRLTYCAEEDTHLPTLTVYETLRFAVRASWNIPTNGHTIDSVVHCLADCFGLSGVLHTKVGNEAIRGVSGGERRRVSLAEAMATCPDLFCLDNPTNGLDSTTALEVMSMLRDFSSTSRCATITSLYQGSDSMMRLFDKVLVINSGRQIFYGPVSDAKEYFESLGFVCPERTTVADFLTSMTAEPQLRHVREGFAHRVPTTALQFEEAFRASRIYTNVVASLSNPSEGVLEGFSPRNSTYALPIHQQIHECAHRQFRIFITDYRTWMSEAACIIIQSVILGTIFRDQDRATKSLFMLASSLFYTVLVPGLQSMNEFSNTFAQRDLVARQKRYRFYRPLSYAIGLVLTDVLWKVVAISYNIPQYFLTGFQRSADKFFTWFCIVYIEHLTLSMIFRSASLFSTSMGRAVLPVGLMFNVFVLYCGLYVPGPQMQVWLFWLKYINPMHYAYESVMINEFGTLNYTCSESDLAPRGQGHAISNQVCAVPGASAGEAFVSGFAILRDQYGFKESHLWRNVGINAGLMVFFIIVTAFGMELYKVPAGRLATIFYDGHVFKRNSMDSEKGNVDEDVPPALPHIASTQSVSGNGVRRGRALLWRNVSLELKMKDGKRTLLDNLSGLVEIGHLTALMGVSGAGKTTLLNALAGRLEIGDLRGEFSLDGKPLPKSFRRHMGYVQQQDIHLPTQTVREALQMTAKLRGSHDVNREGRNAYVEEIIRLLEMEDIASALIGVPGAGMNLEQRKRVSIGVELAAAPDILFLDEPTSGLDGLSAITIVRLLKKLAATGQTILVTIHQPSAEVIELFDHLILLLRGGRLAYQGLLGDKCVDAISYFQRYGRPCNEHENPAEYFLDLVGTQAGTGADWADLWRTSQENNRVTSQLERIPSRASPNDPIFEERTYAAPFHVQLSTVLNRTWSFYWREPDYFVSKLTMNAFNALLNGLTYLNSSNSQQGLYNMIFSAFVSLIIGPPLGLQAIPRFIQLRDIYQLRERGSLTYHWAAFVLSAIIVELPYTFVTNLAYWLLWYFPVGYPQNPYRAGYSFLMYQLFGVFATSMAQLCATIMPNTGAAYAANGFFFMFCNTFAGTLTPKPVTPRGWSWFFNVSPLYYLAEGFTANALEPVEVSCKGTETSVFQLPPGTTCVKYAEDFLKNATGYLLNPNSTSSCEYCRYKDGPSYYAQYGYDTVNRGKDVGVFIGFIAFNYSAVLVWIYLSQKRISRKAKRTKS